MSRHFIQHATSFLRQAPGLIALALVWLPAAGQAQGTSETNAFYSAARAFEDGIYDRAEREFAAFVQRFPNSSQVAEAILLQGRAALRQDNPRVAIDLLTTNLAKAGPLADRFYYWSAEAFLQSSNYPAAAGFFARLIEEFPNSIRTLEASYGEALARFKLGDWPRVAALLQSPNGSFQRAARQRANDELAVRGFLLLAEALLKQGRYQDAASALESLASRDLTPEYEWRRYYLLCQIAQGSGQLPQALNGTTNLLVLAAASGQADLVAESVILQGIILEQLDRPSDAIAAYEQNLADTTPDDKRRRTLLRIIELTLARNRTEEAIEKLDTFFVQHPQDAASGLALLTLGELHLKEALSLQPNDAVASTNAAAFSNHLQQALAHFDNLVGQMPESAMAGKAHLNRGWVLWTEGKFAESQAAFEGAVENLPPSEERTVAQFKVADARFLQKDYTNALQTYRLLINQSAGLPLRQEGLMDHAYYQILRIALETGDIATGTEAMRFLLERFPESFFTDRSLLILGQAFSRSGLFDEARSLLQQFREGFPESPLLPEVELAAARSYVQEGNWPAAIEQYEQWLARFPTNGLLPRAQFNLAWANYQAGHQTNAFVLMTNFVARFPTNELAPQARFWVGDFYFNHKDFVNAQLAYQKLAEAYPNTELSYRARMMAGRAAFANQLWMDAAGPAGHFTILVNDNTLAERFPDLAAEAFFALGDTRLRQDSGTSQPLKRFDDAKDAFSKIPLLYPRSPLVPLAWGRIGDCYLQLGAQDAKHYAMATNAYRRALEHPDASAAARSQAEMGLGLVMERLAQSKAGPDSASALAAARDHYLNIIYRTDQAPDPFWVKEAGLAAARLAEKQKDWQVAVNIYRRLQTMLPPLQSALERRIARAQEHLRDAASE